MSDETIAVVEQVQEVLDSENVVAALRDDAQTEALVAQLDRLTAPGFEVTMVTTPTAGNVRQTRHGIQGFREAWLDWTESFESFRIDVEELIDAGDKVVSLVRQSGVTKTGGVEIEDRAAAVWTVRDGRVTAVEFHLDQEKALQAAGVNRREG